jgi:sulfite exporter TauE/SafE
MDTTFSVLLSSAVAIGFVHTVIGIDHILPFVVLSRAQRWSTRRTLTVTAICGLGHVLSSVLLGVAGLSLGVAITKLEWIEASRGDIASWLLIGFGTLYAAWSIARMRRQQRHVHEHGSGVVHAHEHERAEHSHENISARAVTAWGLFVIFVLGPCEPLIPLLMVPALAWGVHAAIGVAVVFGATTIVTMVACVGLGLAGMRLPGVRRLTRYANVIAGIAVALSGLLIRMAGI